jgi:hypothetical protein
MFIEEKLKQESKNMTTYKVIETKIDVSTIKTNQVKQLVEVLAKHAGKSFDADTLAETLKDNAIKTKQDPYLIFKYYQKRLIALGLLVIEKTNQVRTVIGKSMFIDGAGI